MSKNKIPPDLIAAARDGHLDICEELLKIGASVDVELVLYSSIFVYSFIALGTSYYCTLL